MKPSRPSSDQGSGGSDKSPEQGATRAKPFDDIDDAFRKRQRTSASAFSSSRRSSSGSPSVHASQIAGTHAIVAAASGSLPFRDGSDQSMHDFDCHPMSTQLPMAAQIPSLHQNSGRHLEGTPISSLFTTNILNGSDSNSPSSPPGATPTGTSRTWNAANGQVQDTVKQPDFPSAQVFSRAEYGQTPQPSHSSPVTPHDGGLKLGPAADARLVHLANPQHEPSLDRIFMTFPLCGPNDRPINAVARLLENLASASDRPVDTCVFKPISAWLKTYLDAANRHFQESRIVPDQSQHQFWLALCNVFQTFLTGRPQALSGEAESTSIDFLSVMVDLVAYFLLLDQHTIDSWKIGENYYNTNEIPLLFSIPYLKLFHQLVADARPRFHCWNPGDQSTFFADRLQAQPSGSMEFLGKLAMGVAQIVEIYPKTANDISPLILVLSQRLRRIFQALQTGGQREASSLKLDLEAGHRLWQSLSSCLVTLTQEQGTHLDERSTSRAIRGATEMLEWSLGGDHYQADIAKRDYRQKHPAVPPGFTGRAIAWEWKLQLWSKLIRQGQMHLRLMAASDLCNELVEQFQGLTRPRNQANDALLNHFSAFLVELGLIDYILSPDCPAEIRHHGGNAVGFLLVTKRFSEEHKDRLWRGVSDPQNLHFAESLVRAVLRVFTLFDEADLWYFCARFLDLPLNTLTPLLGFFWSQVHADLCRRAKDLRKPIGAVHFNACLRMLRASSIPASGSQIANPELHRASLQQVRDLVHLESGFETLRRLLQNCFQDLAAKSPTTLGSLWCLHLIFRSGQLGVEIKNLVEQHDLPRLLVEELEHAVRMGQEAGAPAVISGDTNLPRRQLVFYLIWSYPHAITNQLGVSLWDHLVGEHSPCLDDRQSAWQMVFDIADPDAKVQNPYLDMCTSQHLIRIPSSCFCMGMLMIVQRQVIKLVGAGKKNEDTPSSDKSDTPDTPVTSESDKTNTPESSGKDVQKNGSKQGHECALDDEAFVKGSVIELLWRIILEAKDAALAERAIDILATTVYLESSCISSYTRDHAQNVHSSLVGRCLQQIVLAAENIRAATDGITCSEGEPMVIVMMDEGLSKQERVLVRTLRFLHRFKEAHRSHARLSAPGLRTSVSCKPCEIEGAPAQLLYQLYEKSKTSPVQPLHIGVLNTGRSLLANLRQKAGSRDCEFYFRGNPLRLSEEELCQSLEDLHVHEGLIVVHPEQKSQFRIKPGAPFLDIEILSHIRDFWSYMGADDRIAKEIYEFLIKLPADCRIMDLFESPTTTYSDVFIARQPYKTLYALHALTELLEATRLAAQGGDIGFKYRDFSYTSHEETARNAFTLIMQAISDTNLVLGTNSELQADILGSLIHMAVKLLTGNNDSILISLELKQRLERQRGEAADKWLETPHLHIGARLELPTVGRLMSVILGALDMEDGKGLMLLTDSFSLLLRQALENRIFWAQLSVHPSFRPLLCRLALFDERAAIRSQFVHLIQQALGTDIKQQVKAHEKKETEVALSPTSLTACVWTTFLNLLDESVRLPHQCSEFFGVIEFVSFQIAGSLKMSMNDYGSLAEKASGLLRNHTPTEELDDLEPLDAVAQGLVKLLLVCTKIADPLYLRNEADPNVANSLFWSFLVPQLEAEGQAPATTIPKVLLNSNTRKALYDSIFQLVKYDKDRFYSLLVDLKSLVPYNVLNNGDEFCSYEPPFARQRALRSPTHYVGLRNPSNICYSNSLLTQLFMNTEFRRFILSINLGPPSDSHRLLSETQKIFGSMQSSYRRSLDTLPLIGSIMTYEDSPINIDLQMDVGEFHSLLFQRWESQCPNDLVRARLRGFYSGQLVQQIKSTQCAHVSERLEPFSSIQCDIQGKMSLKESLQAYVDGEVLKGENRWSCSGCGVPREAVKRACLKDIPNHLIFHLKRFEWNLETMQRHKVDDFFSFPFTIDMRPYTIEHLSNIENGEVDDKFELVGILVHSGTAENGHYYSYIKERPSSTPDQPKWILFNDDTVSQWDPKLMKDAAFGGPVAGARPREDGVLPNKSHSAYMLFYQRASSITAEEQIMVASKLPSPVQVDIPAGMDAEIATDNTNLLRKHCLFDPNHAEFVKECLTHALGLLDSDDNLQPPDHQESTDAKTTLPQGHRESDQAMEMALSHLDQVISREEDAPHFESLIGVIKKAVMNRAYCALTVHRFFQRHPNSFQMLVLCHEQACVRESTRELFIMVHKMLSSSYPNLYDRTKGDTRLTVVEPRSTDGRCEEDVEDIEWMKDTTMTILEEAMRILDIVGKWQNFYMDSWDQYFGLLLDFAQLGDRQVAHLLAHDYLATAMGAIAADSKVEFALDYTKELRNILGQPNAPKPQFESVLSLIRYLVQRLHPVLGLEFISESPLERLATNRAPFEWSAGEVQLISESSDATLSSFFVEKMLRLKQASNTSSAIVGRLVATGEAMEIRIASVILSNLRGAATQHPMEPFLLAGATYIQTTQSIDRAILLVKHVSNQAPFLQNSEGTAFLEFGTISLGPERRDVEVARVIREVSLSSVPSWAPHLLTYGDDGVRERAEHLLTREVFSLLDDEADGNPPPLVRFDIQAIVFNLGQACLLHLREAFIKRRTAIQRGSADTILRVIDRCLSMADLREHQRRVMSQYHAEIMEAMQGLIVDEVEDDGSDWEGSSCASSEQFEGSQTFQGQKSDTEMI